MSLLPTIDLCGNKVTKLICGGNPLSGFSHSNVRDPIYRKIVSNRGAT